MSAFEQDGAVRVPGLARCIVGAKPIKPVHLDPYDTVKVTCRHVQWLRDELPAFEGQEERYVVWGEGTTDEMCLGILQVTHP